MTRQETGIIMDILTAAYPRFYSGKTQQEMRKAMNLWAEMFTQDDVALVAAAVKALIATDTRGFPPVVGQVREMLAKLTERKEPDEAEAWALVAKAMRNSAYEAEAEFQRLPEPVQRIVGSPHQLRDWSMMDSSTVQSVVASNFQRAYRVRAESARQYRAIPVDVRKLLEPVAERMALPEVAG